VVLSASPVAGAADTPDATVDFSARRGAIGIGYAEGTGTLHFRGSDYPFEVRGLTVGEIGAVSMTATGDVYNLTRVDDLNGSYIAGSAGAAVGKGSEGTAMRNHNGVVIRLRGTTEGVDVRLSIDGFALKVAQ
jgi:hypothetical protein